MITVYSVCTWNKYHPGYVYALRDMVAKYLTIPHEFKCITNLHLPGIHCLKPPVPYFSWWSKIGLFYPGIATGPSIYFDLDVVIVGNINYIVGWAENAEFSAAENWAESGHGGVQSSVMAWKGQWYEPYYRIKPLWSSREDLESGYTILDGKEYWGDQEFIGSIVGDKWSRILHIGSYKYHVRPYQKIPDWMRVCVFHGEPKPSDVKDPWILPYISVLHSHIKESTDNGSLKDLSISV